MTNPLEGKTITLIEMATDKLAMRFTVDGGELVVARADGDCCSSSWIEHVELPAGGLPATVLSLSDLELPGSNESHPEHDCLAVYGLKIVTDKGDMVIDYRNSSNGYYGGSLTWNGDGHYGGVDGQNNSKEVYQPLTKDL